MLCLMGILIDAAVLMFLLQIVTDEEVDLGISAIIAAVTSIATSILAIGLIVVMGIAGIVVAGVIAAAGLGIAISALFGVEIKRSFMIGGIFMVLHIGISIGFQFMFRV